MTSDLVGDNFDMGTTDEAPPAPGEVAADAAADVADGEAADASANGAAAPAPFDAEAAGQDAHGGAEEDDRPSFHRSADAGDAPADAELGHVDPAAERMFGSAPVVDEDAEAASSRGRQAEAYADEANGERNGVPGAMPPEAQATPQPGEGAGESAEIADVVASDDVAPAEITLDSLLLEPSVAMIVIAPNGTVQVERAGGAWELVPALGDAGSLAERVWQLANTAVPPPPSDNPVVDVRLPDGTRVTALFPPIAPLSVCAAIRKSIVPEFSLAALCGHGDAEQILTAAIASRRNILLAGDRPSLGALAGAMAAAIPAERQVLSIGAGAKYRPRWIELAPGGEPAALIRAASAFRADHLLVADPEGSDLPDLLLAAARGQSGIIAAVAARSAAEALTRLRAFCAGVVGPDGFAALAGSTIDLVVFAGAGPDGAVRVLEIVEPVVKGADLAPGFAARRTEPPSAGEPVWEVPGISERLAQAIAAVGDPLPNNLVRH